MERSDWGVTSHQGVLGAVTTANLRLHRIHITTRGLNCYLTEQVMDDIVYSATV